LGTVIWDYFEPEIYTYTAIYTIRAIVEEGDEDVRVLSSSFNGNTLTYNEHINTINNGTLVDQSTSPISNTDYHFGYVPKPIFISDNTIGCLQRSCCSTPYTYDYVEIQFDENNDPEIVSSTNLSTIFDLYITYTNYSLDIIDIEILDDKIWLLINNNINSGEFHLFMLDANLSVQFHKAFGDDLCGVEAGSFLKVVENNKIIVYGEATELDGTMDNFIIKFNEDGIQLN